MNDTNRREANSYWPYMVNNPSGSKKLPSRMDDNGFIDLSFFGSCLVVPLTRALAFLVPPPAHFHGDSSWAGSVDRRNTHMASGYSLSLFQPGCTAWRWLSHPFWSLWSSSYSFYVLKHIRKRTGSWSIQLPVLNPVRSSTALRKQQKQTIWNHTITLSICSLRYQYNWYISKDFQIQV